MKGKINLIEGFGFLFGIANNRKVSLERGRQQQVQTLDIPAFNQISNLYEIQQSLFLDAISLFIQKHAHALPFVSAHPYYAVNA